ncbi:MAG: hypothetical protein E7062_08950 [Spirochaetaceae bacterium]|nr:hypothetical protein [Spirochaetaceae bacterium]
MDTQLVYLPKTTTENFSFSWDAVKQTLLPIVLPFQSQSNQLSLSRHSDILAKKISPKMQIIIVSFQKETVIPITSAMLQSWGVSWNKALKVIHENLLQLSKEIVLVEKEHQNFNYISVHHPIPYFTPMFCLYKPFQQEIQKLLGETFYLTLPETYTAIIFHQDNLPLYCTTLRKEILTTYETSHHPLSPELLEFSNYGLVSLID